MSKKVNPNLLTGFVDDIYNRCPGTFGKKKLIKIAIQKERRILKRLQGKKIKNIIYRLEGTRNIVYKESNECHPGVVMMGLRGSNWLMHPKSVPMEQYAKYFIDNSDAIWLEDNDFQMV